MIIKQFNRTEDAKVNLTAYLLSDENDSGQKPCRGGILIFPGGGYHMCSNREAEPIAASFLAEGYHAFILRYSVKEDAPFPKPLEDAEWAMDLLFEHAQEFQLDKEKIAVCGFSAGGHLAAALGTMGRVRPQAMLLGYPCILESISPILAAPVPSLEKEVDDKTPPCYIFTTAEDKTVPVENSLEFALALSKQKVPFELHVFEKGRHGLSLAKPQTACGDPGAISRVFAQWLPMCVDWLQELFGGPYTL